MIHFIHYSERPGGIEVILPLIIQNMNNFHFSVFVLRPLSENQTKIYRNLNLKVTYGSQNNLITAFLLYKYVKIHRDDIFQTFNIGPYFLLILKLAKVKRIIYSIHGTIYWKTAQQKFIRKLFWLLAINKNVRVISNSEYSKQCFREATNFNGTIQVIYNPFNINKFSTVSVKEDKDLLDIIYVGRLESGKNLDTWIDIAAEISKNYPDITFTIIGQGIQEAQLKNKITRLKLEKKVIFTGFKYDIVDAYREANLLLFLSEYESFGNVAVESILCGTPVIVSAIPSMQEIFQNYPEFLVKLDDGIVKNVLHKIENIQELRTLVPRAREEFKNRFSLEQHLEKLMSIYNSFN